MAKNIYIIDVDGSGEPERLAPSERDQRIFSWSSEGVIAFREAGDIWVLPPDGSPAPFFTSEYFESNATFSPDGQWLAYVSNQNGPRSIYVRPYPAAEPATLIAIPGDGQGNPAWSRDGRQIYFGLRAGEPSMLREPTLMAVDVTPGDEFLQVGLPAPLIVPWTLFADPRGWDVFPDSSFVTRVAEDDNILTGTEAESLFARQIERLGASSTTT